MIEMRLNVGDMVILKGQSGMEVAIITEISMMNGRGLATVYWQDSQLFQKIYTSSLISVEHLKQKRKKKQ
mgnify:CR=1 FL=1